MRNVEIVEMLLDKGAKVSAVDKVRLPPHAAMVCRCQGYRQHPASVS